jgi:spore maturation protein CgeB
LKVLFLEADYLYNDLLPAGLRKVGCEVRMLPEVLNGEIDHVVPDFQPDFALTLGWSWFPSPERLDVIRESLNRYGVPLVFWTTEDPCWHEQYCVPYVQRVQPDLVATICKEYVERYEALGFRAACLPCGYNPAVCRPTAPRLKYACDIAVVANFYTADFHQMNRKRSLHDLLVPLLDQGYDVKIWGSHWNRAPEFGVPLPGGVCRGYLPHREAPAVYNSAKIVIGLQNEFDFETNLTMRTCEILGSGSFLLTSRTKAVEAFFEHKQHLIMSGSPEETRELVAHYLAHPEERAQIAAAGEALVSSQHTYGHRALELLEVLATFETVRALRHDSDRKSDPDPDHKSHPLPRGPYFCCCPCCSHRCRHCHCHHCDCSSSDSSSSSSSSSCDSNSSSSSSSSSSCNSHSSSSSSSSSSSDKCHSSSSSSTSTDKSDRSSSSSSGKSSSSIWSSTGESASDSACDSSDHSGSKV